MFSIADNLENVRQRIKNSALAAGRDSAAISLLPVSKGQSAEHLCAATATGLRCFGENYLNEALMKQTALRELCSADVFRSLVWHFIGSVQANKTKLIAHHFDWVQSVDRAKIAQRLNEQRPALLPPLNVCIQVNIDDETSKSGLPLHEVEDLAAQIAALPRLRLRGLMTIPMAVPESQQLRASFTAMQHQFMALSARYSTVDTLSMGMSADLELAIACGSTMVRVGSALFGAREPQT